VTLTTPMKVVLAVIIIAIIGLGFWMLDWQAKQQQLTQIDKTLEDKRQEKERMEKDVQKIDELVQVNNKLKDELKALVASGFTPESDYNFVPNYLEKVEALVARVAAENRDESFEINSITPGAQQTSAAPGAKKEREASPSPAASPAPAAASVPAALQSYPTRTFQMAMRGRYETLIDFLDRLGHLELQRLVTVNKLSLSPGEAVKTGSPTLTINMPLTAYLRTGGEGQ